MNAVPTFTAEQQIANLALAERLWRERVQPEDIVAGLEVWSCGTQACFGGHLATWPEFREMGVRLLGDAAENRGWVNAPAFTDELWGWRVGRALFGSDTIFDARGESGLDLIEPGGEDHFEGDDHDLVLHRIAGQRERLLSDIASRDDT